eukprot:10260206-Lingulodinium_polyedra.AAC.1
MISEQAFPQTRKFVPNALEENVDGSAVVQCEVGAPTWSGSATSCPMRWRRTWTAARWSSARWEPRRGAN